MTVLRTAHCDVPGCTAALTEEAPNAGWPGWGALHGIAVDTVDNPMLCPHHLQKAADAVFAEKKEG